ncbi:MAG TPA: aminotransferase class I/II-fold pyridoxal phosphate-dependent enzyme [Angustibacter sp.]|nr:aminotransferase class I/II-fold pyridoxal phosphate-dependent enzyme [Angustibacter sp.]
MDLSPVVDLSDAELRRRGGLKWTLPPADVLPAWVAEADVAPAPEITDAVRRAVDAGDFGYPVPDDASGLPEALSGYADRQWAWDVDPGRVVVTADVMSGVLLALLALCDEAPVVVPTPTYPPFLGVVPQSGRELVPVPLEPDAERAALDLDAVDAALAGGARTVLLCNPHNPWGRAFSRDELAALLEVAAARGARIVSDEIHAGLVLPGAGHVPLLSLPGAADLVTTVVSASKAWNLPALKCAQIVCGTEADVRALRELPLVYNHGTSSLGVHAAVAAYTRGGPWLDAWVTRLGENRDLFTQLVSTELPRARTRPMEATYLAWLDLRAYGHDDPAAVALERGRVMVNDGRDFGPGGAGHVRVNLATSTERVERIVGRLADAFEG